MLLKSIDDQPIQVDQKSPIVGSAPMYQGNSPTVTTVASIAPSGESVALLFQDATGANTNVTSLKTAVEIQSVTLSGDPAGSSFVLSFGGKTTVPIAVVAVPPYSCAIWTIPVVAGHSYALAYTSPNRFGTNSSSQVLFEIIDGGHVVASTIVNGQANLFGESTTIFDPGAKWGDGELVPWGPLVGAVVPTGANLEVRVSSSADFGTLFDLDGLRVQDTTANSITYYDDGGPTYTTLPPDGLNHPWPSSPPPSPFTYGGYETVLVGYGMGPRYEATGGASAIQSALQALSTIGVGNVVVVDETTTAGGTYQITFIGTLSFAKQALITCGDPAVLVTETNAGGQAPILTINGGTPVPLYEWVWGATGAANGGYSPLALCPLFQSSPAVQTTTAFSAPFFETGGFWSSPPTYDPSCLSGGACFSSYPGLVASFPFLTLSPGTYQLAATWPTAPYVISGSTYAPSTASQFVVTDSTGATLSTLVLDQTQAPADYKTSDGHGWKVIGSFTIGTANPGLTLAITTAGQNYNLNPQQVVAIIDAVQLTRTTPDQSVVVKPGDVATISIPANWATTQAGAVLAATSLPVAPPSATSIMPAVVASSKSCKVGYNVMPVTYFNDFPSHSNLATQLPSTIGITRDVNCYPLTISGAKTSIFIFDPDIHISDPRQGTPTINGGFFLMMWDGNANHQISLDGVTGTTLVEHTQYQVLTGTTGNRRVYEIRPIQGLAFAPSFSIDIYGTAPDPTDPTGKNYTVNLANLAIYPPDPSDATGNTIWGLNTATGAFTRPPTFHPTFLYKLQGVQSLRFLDPLSANAAPVGIFSHYKATTHISRCDFVNHLNVAVSTIKAPTGSPYVNSDLAFIVQITTAMPHGLYTGATISLQGCGTAAFADGSTVVLDVNTCGYGFAVVLDPTNLLFIGGKIAGGQFSNVANGTTSAMTNTLTGGSLAVQIGTPWPLQDLADLAAAVGVTDFWFNVSAASDTSIGGCVDQTAAFLAAKLPAGVKVHVEYGNEVWNPGDGFRSYYWCQVQNTILTNTPGSYHYETYYAQQANVVHQRFQAMFAAAGRPNDVVFTYATQTNDPPVTTNILQAAQAVGARIDEMAIAIYYGNCPMFLGGSGGEPGQVSLYNRMIPSQLLDYMEVNAMYGGIETCVSSCVPPLAANGYASTKVVAYEGAPGAYVPGTGNPPDGVPNFALRQNACKRHPRIYGIMLRILQNCQDVGLTLWNFYDLGGSSQAGFAWDAWEGFNQQRGTGNSAIDTVNATDPQNRDLIVSEVGGAWNHWASLVPPPKPVVKPARNGLLRSHGLPRGKLRLIR